jgi:hypothetical protein
MPWVLALLNRCCGNYQIKFWIPVQLQDDDYNTKCITLIQKCPSYALLPTIHNACELPAKHDSPCLCDVIQRPWTRTPFAQHTPSDTPLTFPSPIISVTGNCHVSSLIEMIHFPSLEPIIHCTDPCNISWSPILQTLTHCAMCTGHLSWDIYTLCNKTKHQILFQVPNQKRFKCTAASRNATQPHFPCT